MCTNIHHIISNDLESVAQLLLELELRRDDAFRGVLVCPWTSSVLQLSETSGCSLLAFSVIPMEERGDLFR
jgi:hypothetical protein